MGKMATRRQVWEKTGGVCWYCGAPVLLRASIDQLDETMHRDHLVAASAGGSDELHNLVPSCRRCNMKKSHGSLDEFRFRVKADSLGAPRFSVRQADKLASAPDGISVILTPDELSWAETSPRLTIEQLVWASIHGFDVFQRAPDPLFWFERAGT